TDLARSSSTLILEYRWDNQNITRRLKWATQTAISRQWFEKLTSAEVITNNMSTSFVVGAAAFDMVRTAETSGRESVRNVRGDPPDCLWSDFKSADHWPRTCRSLSPTPSYARAVREQILRHGFLPVASVL